MKRLKPWQKCLLLLVHWAIIINFLVQIIYASYMIFDVFSVPGGGTLGTDAVTLSSRLFSSFNRRWLRLLLLALAAAPTTNALSGAVVGDFCGTPKAKALAAILTFVTPQQSLW